MRGKEIVIIRVEDDKTCSVQEVRDAACLPSDFNTITGLSPEQAVAIQRLCNQTYYRGLQDMNHHSFTAFRKIYEEASQSK